jgi:hypothetical protein
MLNDRTPAYVFGMYRIEQTQRVAMVEYCRKHGCTMTDVVRRGISKVIAADAEQAEQVP